MALTLEIPDHDLPEFSALKDVVRHEVYEWMRLLRPVFRGHPGCGIGKALERVAHHIGCSRQTARRMYDLYRNGGTKAGVYYSAGDWRVFVNRSKAPEEVSSVPEPIVQEFQKRVELNQRKTAPAHRKFIRDWRSGQLNHLPWPELAVNGEHPRGCSYRNLLTLLDDCETKAMRQGLGEAWADHGSQMLTTRLNLWVGSHISADDVTRDLEVGLIGNVGAKARIQELGILDIFSGDRYMTHRRPQFERADGTKDSIKGREMRFLWATNFRNVGYSLKGTVVISEGGTAALPEALAKWLYEQSGGKITKRGPGQLGKEQVIAGYYGAGGGNPRHKPHHESHHNLLHNEAADLPAPTGHDRNPPEWLHGIQAISKQVFQWMLELPPERAALLQLPKLEYWQACQLLADIDHRIAWRTDHDLEGWEDLGFTTIEFRANVIGDEWLTPSEFLALPDSQRHELERAASLIPSLSRPRKLAPREVSAPGMQQLCRIPDHVIALMFCDRNLGEDLRESKSLGSVVGDNAFEFSDKYSEPGRMFFDGYRVLRPDGGELRLDQRTKYGTVLNPFDRDRLWIYDAKGGYIGTAPRINRVCPLDDRATEIRLGQLSADKAALLAPLKDRHSDAADQIAELQAHNRAVVAGHDPKLASSTARNDRRAAAAGRLLRASIPAPSAPSPAEGEGDAESWPDLPPIVPTLNPEIETW
jgi:hypothetical protein